MIYSREWLIGQYDQGARLKYLFFWGHTPARNGQITGACFSQWWDQHPFTVDGEVYRTAEHWMMAGKARMFGDEDALHAILAAHTPNEAKKLGRSVRDFDPIAWDERKYELVKTGNRHKFAQHADLKHFLCAAADRVIVEASPVDPIWGIGLAADAPEAANPHQWKGQNLLGFALMEVRDEMAP